MRTLSSTFLSAETDNGATLRKVIRRREAQKGYRDGYKQGFQDANSELVRELKAEIRLLSWQLKERESENIK